MRVAELLEVTGLVRRGDLFCRFDQRAHVLRALAREPVGHEDRNRRLAPAGDVVGLLGAALVAELALQPLPLGHEVLGRGAVELRERFVVGGHATY